MARSYAEKMVEEAETSGKFDKLTQKEFNSKMKEIYNESFSSVIRGLNDGSAKVLETATSPLVSATEAITDNKSLVNGATAAELLLPGGALKEDV